MKTLKKWWNLISLYFATLDANDIQHTPEVKQPIEQKASKGKTEVEKTVRTSTAIKMINESIKAETDSGKKKYKSRLARELNNAIETKDKIKITKSVSRIVKYLNK